MGAWAAQTWAKEPRGDAFENTYENENESPASFSANLTTRGWAEAMQMMVVGDKWEIAIPAAIAFGDSGMLPDIVGGQAIVSVFELVGINGTTVPANTCNLSTLEGCNDKQKEYVEKQKSNGKAKVTSELKRLSRLSYTTGTQMDKEKQAWTKTRLH